MLLAYALFIALIFISASEMRPRFARLVLGGMGIAVVSTPQGLMSGHDARRKNLGGELLFKVW